MPTHSRGVAALLGELTTLDEYEIADAVKSAVESATDGSGFDQYDFIDQLGELGYKVVRK